MKLRNCSHSQLCSIYKHRTHPNLHSLLLEVHTDSQPVYHSL